MRLLSAILIVLLFTASHSVFGFNETMIKGSKPKSLQTLSGVFPNQHAVMNALWAPGIDHGYVVQGLTIADGFVLVSAYLSKNRFKDTGPTRIFKLDPQSGAIVDYFELPEDVYHAGGLAYLGDGTLVVADTQLLYEIDLKRALKDNNCEHAILGNLILAGDLRGSSLAFDGENLLVVLFDGSDDALAYFLSPKLFDTHNNEEIDETNAVRSLSVSASAQGAAFDQSGNLWISYSGDDFGKVSQLDSKTGAIKKSYSLLAGIEDIGFDSNGKLWAMSESGALRFKSWDTQFPVVFALDASKMVADP